MRPNSSYGGPFSHSSRAVSPTLSSLRSTVLIEDLQGSVARGDARPMILAGWPVLHASIVLAGRARLGAGVAQPRARGPLYGSTEKRTRACSNRGADAVPSAIAGVRHPAASVVAGGPSASRMPASPIMRAVAR